MVLIRSSFSFSLPLAGAGARGGGGSLVDPFLPLGFCLVDGGLVVVHESAEGASGEGLLGEAIEHRAVGMALAEVPLDRVSVDVCHHAMPFSHTVHPAAAVGAHAVQAIDAADVQARAFPLLAVSQIVLHAMTRPTAVRPLALVPPSIHTQELSLSVNG